MNSSRRDSSRVFVILVLLAVGAITGLRVLPAYIEFYAVKRALAAMAQGGDIDHSTVKQIRDAFDKRAQMDNIHSVKGDDLDITKEGSRTVVTASYSSKLPLFANVSLLIEFNASGEK